MANIKKILMFTKIGGKDTRYTIQLLLILLKQEMKKL